MKTDWKTGQEAYENSISEEAKRDNLQVYLDEIESVREIYTDVFHLSGKVLDVGGGQGRLRYYLGPETTEYVCIDPMPYNLHVLEEQPNLIKAYPCLINPLPYPSKFVQGIAEDMSRFSNNTFDWVHMRSVIDHMADPKDAMKEAYRVCKPGGHLLIGFAVMKKKPITVRSLWDGLFNPDMHVWHPTVEWLHDTYKSVGWQIEKEHWQKVPFEYCLYSCARKPE